MVMSLGLFRAEGNLTLAAAYESGLVTVARLGTNETWDVIYTARVHGQPVLSLDVAPHKNFFLTSSADAIIAKHPIPATASLPLREPQHPRQAESKSTNTSIPSSLSAALSLEPEPTMPPKQAKPIAITQPLKTINTKHSGQQGLRIRSDGKIFATAGWDSKVRVYSAKTMAELAVLKWHEVGCYAIAFATLADEQAPNLITPELSGAEATGELSGIVDNEDTTMATVSKPSQLSVKDRRIKMAKEAHWLAAGSKDGKISLWDIY